MIARRNYYRSISFRITLGFAISVIFLFAATHQAIAYLGLLAASAILKEIPLAQLESRLRKLQPYTLFASVGLTALLGNLLIPASASAQWQAARDAATQTFGTYIGAPIIELMFNAVFLMLFFLVIGGLSVWGYKSFRNEEASVPMSAFIVGIVIFVGGEVFANLFFTGAATGPGAAPPVGP